MQISDSTHRQTFIDILLDDIRRKASDESLTIPASAARVITEWLGYEPEDLEFIDQRDRGIDAWIAAESGFDLFQVKTHEDDGTIDWLPDLSAFDGSGVQDLNRARDFLLHERETNIQ